MISLTVAALLGAFAVVLWKLVPFVAQRFMPAIRSLPGPPTPSWIYGHLKLVFEEEDDAVFEEWRQKYGPNIKFKGFFGLDHLRTFDTRALNHILTHSAQYQKPLMTRERLERAIGNGVLVTEGEKHRKQRRVMNPAFGPAQIRELTGIFVEKAIELRNNWRAEIALHGEKGPARIDVVDGLTKMTLDVIGLAGFNYRFDSLSGKETELNQALQATLAPPPPMTFFRIILERFPLILKIFPDERMRLEAEAQKIMRRVGMQLIAEKKAEVRREMAEKNLGLERKDLQGRDLLTLLIKANMATDIPDSQRLPDEDVLAQVPTFVTAGHETTSTGTTWALYALAQAPEVQRKLRAELLAVATDTPTMDELNALPYLDCVVREALRVLAPVPVTVRIATEDDVIPVGEPFVDRHGQVQDGIRISKGTPILIPILAMNQSKALWGEDALEFRPERWTDLPAATASVPGVWAHLMTFIGGPRACIGFRFSLVEMKALLFTLVRAFEFDLAVPVEEILKKTEIVRRPVLRGAEERGSQLPLLVTRREEAGEASRQT